MERVASNFDFTIMEKMLFSISADEASISVLSKLKNELNRFFPKIKCREVIYTRNTDKLFFGMRVYPVFDGNEAMEIIGKDKPECFKEYVIELDSKLFDPMLTLDEKELCAILLHEVGHIVNDTATIDEVKKQIDVYMARSGDHIDLKSSKGYRELIAYALKDAVVKTGSLFSKFGNSEMIADTFVVSQGYGPYLESAMKKLSASSYFLNKDVDNRFIALSWVLRLRNEFSIRRVPAIKTLNKAIQLTGSTLEQKELRYAANIMNRADFSEGFVDDIRARFSKKFNDFKIKGIRSIKNDVYELNVRLRTAETIEDLMYIIRQCNSDVAIIQDYLTEEIPEEERKSCLDTLSELYDIRERAAKDKTVRDRYSSAIQIVYPSMD